MRYARVLWKETEGEAREDNLSSVLLFWVPLLPVSLFLLSAGLFLHF